MPIAFIPTFLAINACFLIAGIFIGTKIEQHQRRHQSEIRHRSGYSRRW